MKTMIRTAIAAIVACYSVGAVAESNNACSEIDALISTRDTVRKGLGYVPTTKMKDGKEVHNASYEDLVRQDDDLLAELQGKLEQCPNHPKAGNIQPRFETEARARFIGPSGPLSSDPDEKKVCDMDIQLLQNAVTSFEEALQKEPSTILIDGVEQPHEAFEQIVLFQAKYLARIEQMKKICFERKSATDIEIRRDPERRATALEGRIEVLELLVDRLIIQNERLMRHMTK